MKSNKDNLKLLNELKKRKQLCLMKLDKIESRIKILDSFKKDPSSKNLTLSQYLASKGFDFNQFFAPIGYYTGANKVVSADIESAGLSYAKDMEMDNQIGFPIVVVGIVTNEDKKNIRESEYGMTYDSERRKYIPKNNFNSDTFSKADGIGDVGMDIMGGLTLQDIGNLQNDNYDGEVFTSFVQDLLWEEFDNVEEEFNLIEGSIHKLSVPFSSAEGTDSKKTQSGKNLICRSGCNTKHNKTKRQSCIKECDAKFKSSQKQESRREDRESRKEARQEFRSDRKSCKEAYNKGEMNKKEYNACLKRERREKKSEIKQAGGNVFVRGARGFSKVFPLTALARGGVLTLTDFNAFGFATRLAPALVTEQEAKQKFTPEAIELAKKGWEKTKKSWINLGGNPKNLESKIIKGYRKKPFKVKAENKVKSNVEGIEYEYFSNSTGVDIALAVTSGISALAGLIGAINKSGVKNNPYKEGEAPQEYLDALKDGTIDNIPQQEEYKPHLDPITGEWKDPKTGKVIDPTTGEFKDDIFGINKWLALSIGVVGVIAIYYLFKKKK